MPELPFPGDLDQLRRQARELLRAAAGGDPDALARLRAVSDRVALSAAQLAVAREYGYRSWPALKTRVERDRSIDLSAKPSAPAAVSPDLLVPLEERRSFGGAAAIVTAGGVLLPELLIVGRWYALLDASVVPPAAATPPSSASPRERPLSEEGRFAELDRLTRLPEPTFDDVTLTDDKGKAHALHVTGLAGYPVHPVPEPRPVGVTFQLVPAPARVAAWMELRADNGSATRMVASPRGAVHVSDITPVSAAENDVEDLARWLIRIRLEGSPVGLRQRSIALARAAAIRESGELDAASELPDQLARLCAYLTGERPADDLPPAWSGMLSAAGRSDGLPCHVDIAAVVPTLYGVVIQLDSLISRPRGWKLYLRARPGWFIESEDGMQKWEAASVNAEDDLGGGYLSSLADTNVYTDYEEAALQFLPPLDPRARRLTLKFRAAGGQVAVAFDLPSDHRAS